MKDVDVVVVGGGAAGLSAALVLARARRDVLVVDAESPRNAPAAHMHGFLSRDGFPPAELLAAARDEVVGYGARMVIGTVAEVSANGSSGYRVVLSDGQRIACRRLLVATGLRDELPGNVANPRAQVITAAGEGSAAAIAVNADLVDENMRNAVHRQLTPR